MDRLFKISFAFTNLIVVLFGLPLVVMKSKGGLSFGAGMGIFVIFVYYAFIKFGMSMGYKVIISPMVAAWMGNVTGFYTHLLAHETSLQLVCRVLLEKKKQILNVFSPPKLEYHISGKVMYLKHKSGANMLFILTNAKAFEY